jgi:hypothetical protein
MRTDNPKVPRIEAWSIGPTRFDAEQNVRDVLRGAKLFGMETD